MRRTAAAVTTAAILMGTAGVASTDLDEPEGAGAESAASSLRVDDVWVDAERTFAKVDVDADGAVDIDEYAAQAVAYAGMARSAGLVPVDGRELVLLSVPRDARSAMGVAERAAIDAVARDDYYEAAAGTDGLRLGDWVAMRLQRFGEADADRDGQLTGTELRSYAGAMARIETARG